MSSLAGRFGYANRVAYSTTKWGLVGFTKTLSLELGPLGITANSIHPGAVDGPRIQAVFEGRARVSGRSVEEEIASAMDNQSIKRFVDPADIAALGSLLRPYVDSSQVFILLSAVALFGMGMGNVVGAPLVKKYFPDRQAVMITVFALLMQGGATLPAMTAIPVANGWGWQASLASWGLISLIAIVPWVIQLLKMRSARAGSAADSRSPGQANAGFGLAQLLTNPVAAGTALFYAMASLNIYAMLAWMPTILQQYLGMDREAAALAFSVYTFVTLPMALITPLIANKLNNPTGLAIALAASGPLGYLGILFGIGPAWLMALVAGLAGGAFPLAIAMFNLRSRTTAGSTAIAGFAMGIGYLAGTLGPLLGGWLFVVTGTWAAPLWVYVASVVPMAIGASMMARPGRFLEDGLQK